MVHLDAFQRASALAAKQYAAIAHDQARVAGLSEKQIRDFEREGCG